VRHSRYRLIALAALLAALPFAGTRAVSAATVCVNPHGTNGCYSSINAAITAVTTAPGDTIRIAKGRYVENVVVTKSVTLAGAGDNTVIVPALSRANPCTGSSLCGGLASNIVLVQATNVTIHDLTLDGDNPNLTSGIVRDHADLDARNGIITDNNLGVFNGLTVYNVTVKNIYLRGIYAYYSTFNFHDNCVTNVQGDEFSIAMFNFGGSGRMVRNNVSEANDAISANWSAGTQFLNNQITKSGSGVHTDNSGGGGGTGDVIRGNSVADGMPNGYGIFVFVPYVPVTVINNDVSGVDIGLAAFGGAFSAPTVTSTFTDNTVNGRRTAGSAGVFVTTDTLGYGETDVQANFNHNTVSGFENGVVIQSDAGTSVSVSASCNAITRYTARGVIAGGLATDTFHLGLPTTGGGTQNVTFSLNNITNKLVGMANTGNGVINAPKNYWGCAGGPNTAGCGTISSQVDPTPYLTRPAACAPDGNGKGK
jgi:nitrous oxidase accessory protein NosD